jgi:hypothetical protein
VLVVQELEQLQPLQPPQQLQGSAQAQVQLQARVRVRAATGALLLGSGPPHPGPPQEKSHGEHQGRRWVGAGTRAAQPESHQVCLQAVTSGAGVQP